MLVLSSTVLPQGHHHWYRENSRKSNDPFDLLNLCIWLSIYCILSIINASLTYMTNLAMLPTCCFFFYKSSHELDEVNIFLFERRKIIFYFPFNLLPFFLDLGFNPHEVIGYRILIKCLKS